MSYDAPLSARADLGMAAAREREPLPAAQPLPVEPRQVLGTGEVECHDGATLWTRDAAETFDAPTGSVTRVHREHVLDRFDPHPYLAVQPPDIPVLHRHDRTRPVGHVLHLEWAQASPRAFWPSSMWTRPKRISGRNGTCSFRPAPAPATGEGGSCWIISRWSRPRPALVRPPSGGRAQASTGGALVPQSTPGFRLLTRAHAAIRARASSEGIPIVGHPGSDDEHDRRYDPRDAPAGRVLLPSYMRRNGEDGVFYSGGVGRSCV